MSVSSCLTTIAGGEGCPLLRTLYRSLKIAVLVNLLDSAAGYNEILSVKKKKGSVKRYKTIAVFLVTLKFVNYL